MLSGRYSHDEELPPEHYQGFSRQPQNMDLEPSNLKTLQEVLAHYHKIKSKQPPYHLQTAGPNIRDKEENVPFNSAERRVSLHLNSRGAVVLPSNPSSIVNHTIPEKSDPMSIVAHSEHNGDNQMHPSRHETAHGQNHNLGPSLDRQTDLLPDLEALRHFTFHWQVRNPPI